MNPRLLEIDVTSSASIANLGPGYDCLAISVDLVNKFTLYVNSRELDEGYEKEFDIYLAGDYAMVDPRLTTVDGNLFIRSFRFAVSYLCRHIEQPVPRRPIMIYQEVSIPPMRGLGSSSSACVAGVVAAVHFLNDTFPGENLSSKLKDFDLCASLAMDTDNCPDNICACLAGGLTYSFLESDSSAGSDLQRVHFFREEIDDPDLRIVALVPSNTLGTPEARKYLEGLTYSSSDAAFNISRSTCIPAIFRNKSYKYLKDAMKDRIHQQQRASEFYKDDRNKPMDLEIIFDKVVKAGAYGACISGAGSTLVAFAHSDRAFDVEKAFRKAFKEIAKPNWTVNCVRTLTPSNVPTAATVSTNPAIPRSVSRWWKRKPPFPFEWAAAKSR